MLKFFTKQAGHYGFIGIIQSELVRETVENPHMKTEKNIEATLEELGWGESLRKVRNRILKTMVTVSVNHGERYETLGIVLSEIQQYLNGCFELSANPLPHLRKYFPGLEWKCHHIRETNCDRSIRAIQNADFIWCPMGLTGSFLFTARRKDGDCPWRICWDEHDEGEVPTGTDWSPEVIKRSKAKLLMLCGGDSETGTRNITSLID